MTVRIQLLQHLVGMTGSLTRNSPHHTKKFREFISHFGLSMQWNGRWHGQFQYALFSALGQLEKPMLLGLTCNMQRKTSYTASTWNIITTSWKHKMPSDKSWIKDHVISKTKMTFAPSQHEQGGWPYLHQVIETSHSLPEGKEEVTLRILFVTKENFLLKEHLQLLLN